MQKLNVAVIGVGWFGELHIQVYSSLPQVNLVGFFDENLQRMEDISNRYHIRAFQTIDELLESSLIDAVSICTGDQNHLSPVLKACRAGKHVLVEKPMARTIEDCDIMIDAAQKAGIKLMPGHLLRFNNSFIVAKDRIFKGEIGSLSHIYTHRSLPKSAAHRISDWGEYHSILFHLAVHDIDIISWLADDMIVEVYADFHSGILESEGIALSDAVLSLLRFKRGALSLMEQSWVHPDNYPILVEAQTQLTGSKGKIEIDLSGRGGVSYTNNAVHHFAETYWPVIDGQTSCDLRNELDVFTKCLLAEDPLPITMEEGRYPICVVTAIIESLKNQKKTYVMS
ncbi:MAG: Gfo/Idh/MocA family oxidoreductase [Clostridiaceae bacterium]|nr:Gfo/Idh/MocA family oxidoreductase [Clostridiaceae bacterium]